MKYGEKRTMLNREETFVIEADNYEATFIHKCCGCGLRHDVTIDMYEEEAHVTFKELREGD